MKEGASAAQPSLRDERVREPLSHDAGERRSSRRRPAGDDLRQHVVHEGRHEQRPHPGWRQPHWHVVERALRRGRQLGRWPRPILTGLLWGHLGTMLRRLRLDRVCSNPWWDPMRSSRPAHSPSILPSSTQRVLSTVPLTVLSSCNDHPTTLTPCVEGDTRDVPAHGPYRNQVSPAA